MNSNLKQWSLVTSAATVASRAALVALVTCLFAQSLSGAPAGANSAGLAFVRVSPRDPRYFELTDGKPYIPVGFNLVGPPEARDLERVVETMAAHGVNYCRIWLDQPLWSVEHKQSGQYDPEK